MARKKKKCPPGLAPWVLTFGDCMTLLLTFFVLLFSMSSIDIIKFNQIVESFDGAFGVLSGGEVTSFGLLKKAKATKPTKKMSEVEEKEIKEQIKEQKKKISSMTSVIEEIQKKEIDKQSQQKLAELKEELLNMNRQLNKMVSMDSKLEVQKNIRDTQAEKLAKIQGVIEDIKEVEIAEENIKKLTLLYNKTDILKNQFIKEKEKIEKMLNLDEYDALLEEQIINEMQKLAGELDNKYSEMEKNTGSAIPHDDKIKVSVFKSTEGLMIRIQGNAFFSSGIERWKNEYNDTLQKIGEALKGSDRRIRIEGHTDSDPITGRLKNKFDSNWELSTARAVNVLRYFTEKMKLDAKRFSASGYGEFQPISSNKSEAGKSQNRRVDILLLNREKNSSN